MEILGKGEIQLSEKERSAQQDSLLKEICTMIAEKCINPQSKLAPLSTYVRAMLCPVLITMVLPGVQSLSESSNARYQNCTSTPSSRTPPRSATRLMFFPVLT